MNSIFRNTRARKRTAFPEPIITALTVPAAVQRLAASNSTVDVGSSHAKQR